MQILNNLTLFKRQSQKVLSSLVVGVYLRLMAFDGFSMHGRWYNGGNLGSPAYKRPKKTKTKQNKFSMFP